MSDALQDARRHRQALAGAAHNWAGKTIDMADLHPDDRAVVWEDTGRVAGHILPTARELSSGIALWLDSRPTRWALDLRDVARRLSLCERSSALRSTPSGGWQRITLGCGVRLCPVCSRLRSARAVVRWKPVLSAAASDGAEIRHWTLTHRTIPGPGGLVTREERDRYGWQGVCVDSVDGLGWDNDRGEFVGVPTGGETLRASYDRLRGRLRAVRQDRASRALLSEAWPAYLLGCEWTGREPKTSRPRWHCHAHVLTVSPRPVPQSTVRAALLAWQSRKGKGEAGNRSQYCDVVDDGHLAEVLKYPFKPASLTQAQRIETLASARGQKPHQVGGAFHACSRAHHTAPWATWLAARSEPETRRRLHLVPRPAGAEVGTLQTGEPVLFTGQIEVGEANIAHTWAVRTDDGGWRRWLEPAAPYLRLLGLPTEESELPEPGSEED